MHGKMFIRMFSDENNTRLIGSNDINVLENFFVFENIEVECTKITPKNNGTSIYISKFGVTKTFDKKHPIIVAGLYDKRLPLPFVLIPTTAYSDYMNKINKLIDYEKRVELIEAKIQNLKNFKNKFILGD